MGQEGRATQRSPDQRPATHSIGGEAREREAWMRRQIEELTGTVKLLEDKRSPPAVPQEKGFKKRRWWRWGH